MSPSILKLRKFNPETTEIRIAVNQKEIIEWGEQQVFRKKISLKSAKTR